MVERTHGGETTWIKFGETGLQIVLDNEQNTSLLHFTPNQESEPVEDLPLAIANTRLFAKGILDLIDDYNNNPDLYFEIIQGVTHEKFAKMMDTAFRTTQKPVYSFYETFWPYDMEAFNFSINLKELSQNQEIIERLQKVAKN